MLIELLQNLINKKYYENKEEIENKLNVFYAMNKITDEEYSALTLKVEEVYKAEAVEEKVVDSEDNIGVNDEENKVTNEVTEGV